MTAMKNLSPEQITLVKSLKEGQIVKVECDHHEFGRIACRGTITDLRGTRDRNALVHLDGPVMGFCDVDVMIPKRDIRPINLRAGEFGI